MTNWQLQTPITFLIFNRPDTTARVFEEIRRARPPKLLVVADGPRPNRPGEAEKVAATRAIVEQVDWPCQVLKNYADTNLGCKRRVSSGLDWVFQIVDEAIILEDDCLPHPTFFRFCEELLEKYRDDERVMHITGTNFGFVPCKSESSYYFTRYNHVWGWASWRRAWRHYDVNMKLWRSVKNKKAYLRIFTNQAEKKFWRKTCDAVCDGMIDTWDYQWAFASMVRNSIAIAPNTNLISNIGFTQGATHTPKLNRIANLPSGEMKFPLKHPQGFTANDEVDKLTSEFFFQMPSLTTRAVRKVKRTLRAILRQT